MLLSSTTFPDLFTFNLEIHDHNTRYFILYIPTITRTTLRLVGGRLLNRGPTYWDDLPVNIKIY